jgi:hypothetical protein
MDFEPESPRVKYYVAAAALLLGGIVFWKKYGKHLTSDPNYVPARDMSQAQALKALSDFDRTGTITLRGPDKDGFVDMNTTLSGVQMQYAGKPLAVTHVDPRFAVLLVRLAQMLQSKYGATVIEHAGIYPGIGSPTDVHNRGAAIDLTGVKTLTGNYSVAKDWGLARSPNPGHYRLREDDRGYELFKDIYAFATQEAQDDPSYGNAPPSEIGGHSLIVTPDHPEAALAIKHKDHMHVQIGKTVV